MNLKRVPVIMPDTNKKFGHLWVFGLTLIILFFAFSPGHYTPSFFSDHDKLTHLAAFFLLTLLARHTFYWLKNFTLFISLSLLATGIEIFQYFFTSREFSIVDASVGIISVLLGLLAYTIIHYLKGF